MAVPTLADVPFTAVTRWARSPLSISVSLASRPALPVAVIDLGGGRSPAVGDRDRTAVDARMVSVTVAVEWRPLRP